MQITVLDGEGIIKLLDDGFATCVIIKEPAAINWPDCTGSVGEYYSISENFSHERKQLSEGLNEVLVTGKIEEILRKVQEFLQLFENGTYEINIDQIDLKNSHFVGENQVTYAEWVPGNERFFGGFYPLGDEYEHEDYYIYTIRSNKIDQARVDYYERIINEGLRPYIVTFQALNRWGITNAFVIDGHHKAEAYQKLGINIPVVKILKHPVDTNNVSNELLKAAKTILKNFELQHLLLNNFENYDNMKFESDAELTTVLDNILSNSVHLGLIPAFLIRKFKTSTHSDELIKWINERLEKLYNNKFIGQRLTLPFTRSDDIDKNGQWTSKPIENRIDISEWISLELNSSFLTSKDEAELIHAYNIKNKTGWWSKLKSKFLS